MSSPSHILICSQKRQQSFSVPLVLPSMSACPCTSPFGCFTWPVASPLCVLLRGVPGGVNMPLTLLDPVGERPSTLVSLGCCSASKELPDADPGFYIVIQTPSDMPGGGPMTENPLSERNAYKQAIRYDLPLATLVISKCRISRGLQNCTCSDPSGSDCTRCALPIPPILSTHNHRLQCHW